MISPSTSFTGQPTLILRKPVSPPEPAEPEATKPAVDKPKITSPLIPVKAESAQSAVVKEAAALGLKPFAEVAREARAALDAGYKRIGERFTKDNYLTGQEWEEGIGVINFDRRTIFAIASNEGGLFSKWESMYASSTMHSLQWNAMVEAQPALARFSEQDYLSGDPSAMSHLLG